MKKFVAKYNSRVECVVCNKKMLKGEERVNVREVYKEEYGIYAVTHYVHADCYSKHKVSK